MEEELSMLKKSLISLVVSSPTTMTVSRLLKDYRSMIGGVLPLAKYGYREPLLFLRERCTDIFVIEGSSWDPILTPKVTKNLAHIDQMVQKQKMQSTAKHKGKRRSYLLPNPPVERKPVNRSNPPNRYDSPNRFDNQNKREPQNGHIQSNGYKNNTNKCNASNMYEKKTPFEPEIPLKPPNQAQAKSKEDVNKENECNFKHIDNSNMKTSDSSKSIFNNDEKENDDIEQRPMSALSKFYKKRLPQYNSDMDLEQTSKSSAESAGKSSISSGSKQALLDELKAEIVALIEESPGGVWCTDLIKLYKETYGRELKFNRFGHTRLISLIYSMEDLVVVTRPAPDSDWLLQDPKSVVAGAGPAVDAAPRRVRRLKPATATNTDDDDDALPGVDFDTDVFPADCLHYLESIPGAGLGDAAPGDTLEVLVGEVYSPSHFWMLRVGEQYNQAMEAIMDEMNEYYTADAGAGRVLSRGAVRPGQYCAALFDGDWHRALIVCIEDSDTVKVRHVDYGTVDTVQAGSLKPLLRGWGALPAQAVRGRLAGVRPAGGGWRWPRAACAAFLRAVQERRLYAHVAQRDAVRDVLETFLIDTSGKRDLCLSKELIRVGHADERADSALTSEECYLYPRFEALESGAAPNYADICRMLADGINIEYVDSYRRHVPGPWTRPRPPTVHQPPPPQEEDCPAPGPSPPPPQASSLLQHLPSSQPQASSLLQHLPSSQPQASSLLQHLPSSQPQDSSLLQHLPSSQPQASSLLQHLPSSQPQASSLLQHLPSSQPQASSLLQHLPSSQPQASSLLQHLPSSQPQASPLLQHLPSSQPQASPLLQHLPSSQPQASPLLQHLPSSQPQASPLLQHLPSSQPQASPLLQHLPSSQPQASSLLQHLPSSQPQASPLLQHLPSSQQQPSPLLQHLPSSQPQASSLLQHLPSSQPQASPLLQHLPSSQQQPSPLLQHLPSSQPQASPLLQHLSSSKQQPSPLLQHLPSSQQQPSPLLRPFPPPQPQRSLQFSHPPQPSPPPQPQPPLQSSQRLQSSHPPQSTHPRQPTPSPQAIPQLPHPAPQGSCAQPPDLVAWPPAARGGACVAEGDGPLEMRLSEAEWAVLSRLRGVDPTAARWFLLTSACRTLLPPPGL